MATGHGAWPAAWLGGATVNLQSNYVLVCASSSPQCTHPEDDCRDNGSAAAPLVVAVDSAQAAA